MKTKATPNTFRNERAYPFCPGCGHVSILERLNGAFVKLNADPKKIVIVSDIGCSGLSDQYFDTNAFHGLHGRSVTYASGIKMARPDLDVIVIMGDGGCGIGGHHLISAARRNIGITVLVMNNLTFGMTGGQYSATTPQGAITSTSRKGHLEWPMDICETVGVNGASYVRRGTNFDKDLTDHIATAMRTKGFALLDIWDMCTAYYQPMNEIKGKDLTAMMDRLNLTYGLICERQREEFPIAIRHDEVPLKSYASAKQLMPRFNSPLNERTHIVIAGSAGGKVRSTTRVICQAGILSGLFAAQRDDYPVTVMKGHSVSDLILAPHPVSYTGGERPDVLLILSEDGLRMVEGYLSKMQKSDRIFVVPPFQDIETEATIELIDIKQISQAALRAGQSMLAVAVMMARLGFLTQEAMQEAVNLAPAAYREQNVKWLQLGMEQGG